MLILYGYQLCFWYIGTSIVFVSDTIKDKGYKWNTILIWKNLDIHSEQGVYSIPYEVIIFKFMNEVYKMGSGLGGNITKLLMFFFSRATMKFYDQFFTVGRYIILKQYRIHDDLQLMNVLKWNIDTSKTKIKLTFNSNYKLHSK